MRDMNMRPYARNGKKIRINNRKKFSATRGKVSWEFSPSGYPRKVGSLSLMVKRLERTQRQGLTKKQRDKYAQAML